jgi:hypothetical protein
MNNFEELLVAVRACSPEQKQKIFSEIRGSILVHDLERSFNVRAEVILEAISRSNDLTQRGVRGLIAEMAFVLDVIPTIEGWESDPPIGDLSYDACLTKDNRRVRIQVKMQRKKKGIAWLRKGSHVVEVQRTRTGKGKDGTATRPYRFGEFDLLAVCMQASTGDWHSFMYVPSSALTAKSSSKDEIETFQTIPAFGDNGIWTSDPVTALDRVS